MMMMMMIKKVNNTTIAERFSLQNKNQITFQKKIEISPKMKSTHTHTHFFAIWTGINIFSCLFFFEIV